jgi:ketol-acid reductoisomerase
MTSIYGDADADPGEVERTCGPLRRDGFAAQLEHHSPASQYGQLSGRGVHDEHDVLSPMRGLVEEIQSGRFAGEWDAESRAGHPRLRESKQVHAGPGVRALAAKLRRRLGPDRRDGD